MIDNYTVHTARKHVLQIFEKRLIIVDFRLPPLIYNLTILNIFIYLINFLFDLSLVDPRYVDDIQITVRHVLFVFVEYVDVLLLVVIRVVKIRLWPIAGHVFHIDHYFEVFLGV